MSMSVRPTVLLSEHNGLTLQENISLLSALLLAVRPEPLRVSASSGRHPESIFSLSSTSCPPESIFSLLLPSGSPGKQPLLHTPPFPTCFSPYPNTQLIFRQFSDNVCPSCCLPIPRIALGFFRIFWPTPESIFSLLSTI